MHITFSLPLDQLRQLWPSLSFSLLSSRAFASMPFLTQLKLSEPLLLKISESEMKIFSILSFSRDFFRSTFKSPKRCDTPEEFKDIDDSDEEDSRTQRGSSGAPRQARLFSTPQHNPHNPFNATSQSPNRRHN